MPMSERLTSITLSAFRGISDELTISLPKGESLLVYGENGSGKSSVADAIEWYFTGSLELLAKEGRDHAFRHLGSAKRKTQVTVSTTGGLAGTCEEKKPNKAAIDLANLETFLLRGRTIAEFVDKSKGEKWSALQQLLGLGGIDELRVDLQKARNGLNRAHDEALRALAAEEGTLRARGVEPTDAAVLASLTNLAESCGRPARTTIDAYLSDDPRTSARATEDARDSGPTAEEILDELPATGPRIQLERLTEWNDWVAAVARAPSQALELLTSAARYCKARSEPVDRCPVCDQPTNDDTFRARIVSELAGLHEDASRAEAAHAAATTVFDDILEAFRLRGSLRTQATRCKDPVSLPELPRDPSSSVESAIRERATIDVGPLHNWVDALSAWDAAARGALEAVASTRTGGPSSATGAAIELGALLTFVRRWRVASRHAARISRAALRAEALFEPYHRAQRQYVEDVLRGISADVDVLYRKLHPRGPVAAVTIETWEEKGIELAVDFHGIRQRPPQGVLSESHMNSLAIALFLAMARAFNERVGFLVLDDVVNSFDVTNRGRLGDVLVEDLVGWQVILLTHDRYFFDQMKARGNGWAVRQFVAWSFDNGPVVREHRPIGEASVALDELATGEIGGAARRGRRALEQTLKEVCEGLGVPVPYRRGHDNELREVGGLLIALRSHLKKEAKSFLVGAETLLAALETDARIVLNTESHASEAPCSADDVRIALERVQSFDQLWSCDACKTRVWKVQGVRCKCGKSPFPPA